MTIILDSVLAQHQGTSLLIYLGLSTAICEGRLGELDQAHREVSRQFYGRFRPGWQLQHLCKDSPRLRHLARETVAGHERPRGAHKPAGTVRGRRPGDTSDLSLSEVATIDR